VPAERTYKALAIVLRARNLGEADKIFTLLTDVRGKVDAVGKGIRRAKSQIAGRLEFGCEVMLGLHRGRNLDVITSADLVTPRWAALVQPAAFAAASMLAELVDAFCEPDLAVPDVYALLDRALDALGKAPDPGALVPRFELRLLTALGIGPQSDACVRCGGDFEGGPAWADLDAGGLACAVCRPHGAEALALDPSDVENFRGLCASGAGATRATVHATPQARRIADAFVTYHLGKRPKSARLLDELAAKPA
jgi:DNA repair protein RecO (recombination protein O)